MSLFKPLLPAFLKLGSSQSQTPNAPLRPVLPRPHSPTASLHRKLTTLESALRTAESHLHTLRAKIWQTFTAYERHYIFLRSIAYSNADLANTNVSLHRSETLLKSRDEVLSEAFEELETAVQVAGLKARAVKGEAEALAQECERLRDVQDGGEECSGEGERKAKARARWECVEREEGEVSHAEDLLKGKAGHVSES